MTEPNDDTQYRSPDPHLFTEHADPTVVECVRVREAAETKRQAQALRSRLIENGGIQQLVALSIAAAAIAAPIMTCSIATRNKPPAPVIIESPEKEAPPSTPKPCVDSMTMVSILSGAKFECSNGAHVELRPIAGDDTTHVMMVCKCEQPPPSASSATPQPTPSSTPSAPKQAAGTREACIAFCGGNEQLTYSALGCLCGESTAERNK
jgi:hypothetical protein